MGRLWYVRQHRGRTEQISRSSGDRFDPESHVTNDSQQDRMRGSTKTTVQLSSGQTLLVKNAKWWNLPALFCSLSPVNGPKLFFFFIILGPSILLSCVTV